MGSLPRRTERHCCEPPMSVAPCWCTLARCDMCMCECCVPCASMCVCRPAALPSPLPRHRPLLVAVHLHTCGLASSVACGALSGVQVDSDHDAVVKDLPPSTPTHSCSCKPLTLGAMRTALRLRKVLGKWVSCCLFNGRCGIRGCAGENRGPWPLIRLSTRELSLGCSCGSVLGNSCRPQALRASWLHGCGLRFDRPPLPKSPP